MNYPIVNNDSINMNNTLGQGLIGLMDPYLSKLLIFLQQSKGVTNVTIEELRNVWNLPVIHTVQTIQTVNPSHGNALPKVNNGITCKHPLKTGPNSGFLCQKKPTDSGYCRTHAKKYAENPNYGDKRLSPKKSPIVKPIFGLPKPPPSIGNMKLPSTVIIGCEDVNVPPTSIVNGVNTTSISIFTPPPTSIGNGVNTVSTNSPPPPLNMNNNVHTEPRPFGIIQNNNQLGIPPPMNNNISIFNLPAFNQNNEDEDDDGDIDEDSEEYNQQLADLAQ